MGHYYSEMVSDEELTEKANRKQSRINKRAAEIARLIEENGLPMVLAMMADDPDLFRVRTG